MQLDVPIRSAAHVLMRAVAAAPPRATYSTSGSPNTPASRYVRGYARSSIRLTPTPTDTSTQAIYGLRASTWGWLRRWASRRHAPPRAPRPACTPATPSHDLLSPSCVAGRSACHCQAPLRRGEGRTRRACTARPYTGRACTGRACTRRASNGRASNGRANLDFNRDEPRHDGR